LDQQAHAMNDEQWRKLEAIVFDFDGTLAELHLDFADMKRRLRLLALEYLKDVPTPPVLPALEWLEGLIAKLREIDEAAALDFEERAGALIKDIEVDAARRGSLFPFTRSLLRDLQTAGIKVAIITRNCEQAVRIVFPDLNQYCAGFLARDHVNRVKPDPDHLLQALEKIASPPETALMVGDHPLDVQTGHRSGILTAGVASGHASQEDLARSGADFTAQDCEELIEVLKVRGLL
jgi:phosphoglycolate phosphatase